MLWSNQPFLCRSTMEHVYGILLDEKFLYRSEHAAFANTKRCEAWLERTRLLDPIIFDMWNPGVLSCEPGQHCNSHHARHTRCSVSSLWSFCRCLVIALYFGVFFFCVRRSTRTQFLHASAFTDHRIQFLSTSITKIDGSCSSPGAAGCTAIYVRFRSRHVFSASLGTPRADGDKYVWLVQSRRRPEKWTRTRKAGSRGSATPDPVS